MRQSPAKPPVIATPDQATQPDRPVPKILLLSDTHGALHPRILALAATVDGVVHAGDIGDPAILDLLASVANGLIAVRGNNDVAGRWPGARHADLAALGERAELQLPGGCLVVEHGHRVNPAAHRHAGLRARHGGARAVVYGHTHRQTVDTACKPWIINPGAAGRSRTFGGSGCALLEATARRWRVQTFQFPLADWKT
ncbi:MAG: metallophosphoesterase family protein [Gammaproteobacteria bacterium]|nr:metallophosphoesterase family protein [Gammaproteobacteria bacterium]